jgi:hypothetical protein
MPRANNEILIDPAVAVHQPHGRVASVNQTRRVVMSVESMQRFYMGG